MRSETIARSERAEVVVVGSGAGGATIAAELAEGGRDVVLLEEGGHYQTRDFTVDAPQMMRKLYRNGGYSVIRGRPNVAFAEGRCVGGSTVVNGGICWRTPPRVLDRWQRGLGLAGLSADHMEPFFDRVEERIHVALQPPHTLGRDSELLRAGAERLGHRVVPVRRNQRGCCGSGSCVLGCPSGAKQSALVTFVSRALAHGARLRAGCRVERVLTDGRRVTGVRARFRDPETGVAGPPLTVTAPVVVLAGGAVQSPALLARSRLGRGSPVGQHLHIHPNAKVVGLFDEDVHAWRGTIQGYQVHEFLDEGLMMTTTMVPPGLLALGLPAVGASSLALMRDYNRMLACGVLVEDTVSGSVTVDAFGEAVPRYSLGERDRDTLVRGVALLAEILFAAGARRVLLPFVDHAALGAPDEISRLYARPIPTERIECFSIHVMGTCRMGRDERSSVVDRWGESHQVPGLFVADASVLPTPIGVNPQVTIMALAMRTGRHLLERSARYWRC